MGIIGDIKAVAGDIQKLGNIDIYQRLIAIQEMVLELLDKDFELKEENLRLKKDADISEHLEFRNDVYWLRSENPGEKGPYCPRCRDAKGKLIHFIGGMEGNMKCSDCHLIMRDIRGYVR